MNDALLRLFRWNLLYAEALVADVDERQAGLTAGPGLENHPLWTLGHLVTGANMIACDLGLEDDLPLGWRELFERRGPGDPRLPEEDAALYPSIREVLEELRRQHARVEDAWRGVSDERWNEREDWAFGSDLPTLADATLFMALTHESLHLGQLAAWRRARGLPSALLTMKETRED